MSIKQKDAEELLKSGVLKKETYNKLKEKKDRKGKKLVTKGKNPQKFIKNGDGKWVQPRFYYRGGGPKGTDQKKLDAEIEKSINKYTTVR